MKHPHSKPFLPDLETYQARIAEIWASGWLTNHGPELRSFEKALSQFLDVEHLCFVSSGTMGLQCMLRELPRGGEIITTPYSYVATSGALFWEGFRPRFVDIDPRRLCPRADDIRRHIVPNTRAILLTHVYGIPAFPVEMEALAKEFGLPLLYDAAHCFGVKYRDKSLLTYGDMAVLSTHATKIFHTANGGAVVTSGAEIRKRIEGYRNFGHDGPNEFKGPGINGKNSELHAALGLAILAEAEQLLEKRREQWHRYRELLSQIGDEHFLEIPADTEHNGAYFPLLHLDRKGADRLEQNAREDGIELRRYFQPALNRIDYLQGEPCPVAEAIAETVLCLPLYHTLSAADQEWIAEKVLSYL